MSRSAFSDLFSYSIVTVLIFIFVPSGAASGREITCFMKKGVEVEQERDADKRKTTIFGRNVKVIAATNLDKIAKLGA